MIFTAFGDMMRVPGTHGSPLEHKARGADVRIVYSPADALKLARANPERHVMFFAIGFETTAPSTALTLMRAKAEGIRNFSVFCNHVTIIPAIRAILDSPDMRIDAFIGPGHVSTVIGCRPYEWIARNEGKPIVVSGFEPLDVLQSVVMILRQLQAGEAKVENQYRRVVPWEGNRAALKAMADVFKLRSYFEWRGMGFISQSALASERFVRGLGRREAFRNSRHPRHRSESGAMRRSAQGGVEAGAMQALRQRMHAGTSGGRADGVVGRVVRGLLPVRVSQEGAGFDWGVVEEGSRMHDTIAAPPKIRFRDRADRDGARRGRKGQPPADRRVCSRRFSAGAPRNLWATPRTSM